MSEGLFQSEERLGQSGKTTQTIFATAKTDRQPHDDDKQHGK
jgi:hypothetical protein